MLNPILPVPRDVHPEENPQIPEILPHERMYSIQIGDKLFKLSGASLSYDSPSYFTDYFSQPNNEYGTLFIDRSPRVFKKICQHLQGYSIKVQDEYEFMYLYADTTYFRLNKLRLKLLDEGLFVNIGGETFQISKAIFRQKGNSPNYFTVLYETLQADPFLNSKVLIRPPSMTPYKIHRSPLLFRQLLYLLTGGIVDIKDENHRKQLIEEARYYSFFALEQQLTKTDIRKNPFTMHDEILINFNDIKKDGMINVSSSNQEALVQYSRPHCDRIGRDLVIQIISAEVTLLIDANDSFCSLSVVGKTAKILYGLLSVVSDDVIFEQTDTQLKLTLLVRLDNCYSHINSVEMQDGWISKLVEARKHKLSSLPMSDPSFFNSNVPRPTQTSINTRKVPPQVIAIKVLRSQWTISVTGRHRILANGVMIDGVSDEANYNNRRGFI